MGWGVISMKIWQETLLKNTKQFEVSGSGPTNSLVSTVMNTCNHSALRLTQDCCKFKANLSYIVKPILVSLLAFLECAVLGKLCSPNTLVNSMLHLLLCNTVIAK